MPMTKRKILVYSKTEYPCQRDDLITKKGKTIATIYTEKEAEKEKLAQGIRKAKNGIYDIVICGTEINNEIARNALKNLEKKTNKEYRFVSKKTFEDKIIDYANKLNSLADKYKDKNNCYDFSKAKSPSKKRNIIKSWIGEILYEAVAYKNVKALKSLTKIIGIEINDIIKQK